MGFSRGLITIGCCAAAVLLFSQPAWPQAEAPLTRRAVTPPAGTSAPSAGATTAPGTGSTPGASAGGAAASSANPDAAAAAAKPAEAPPGQIVIHRQRLHLRSPEKYQVGIPLEPNRTVRLAAPFDGAVKAILHKTGDKLEPGAEAVRLDTTEKQLLLDRAKALYRAAQIEAEQPQTGAGSSATQLAAARLQAAKADLDLAVYRMQQGAVRVPFTAEVFRVDVSEGQVVRVGETMLTLGETTTLKAELPMERSTAVVGQPIQIKVEDRTVPAKIEAVLPLSARFQSLRDLVPSAASVIAVLENADGKLKAGQTVFSPIVPREPIAELPNSCIGNAADGTHKVQVLRDNVVRDVRIISLGPIGADRSFVSGPFDAADEVIVSTSQELPDGTVVRATVAAAALDPAKAAASTRAKLPGSEPPATPAAKGGAF